MFLNKVKPFIEIDEDKTNYIIKNHDGKDLFFKVTNDKFWKEFENVSKNNYACEFYQSQVNQLCKLTVNFEISKNLKVNTKFCDQNELKNKDSISTKIAHFCRRLFYFAKKRKVIDVHVAILTCKHKIQINFLNIFYDRENFKEEKFINCIREKEKYDIFTNICVNADKKYICGAIDENSISYKCKKLLYITETKIVPIADVYDFFDIKQKKYLLSKSLCSDNKNELEDDFDSSVSDFTENFQTESVKDEMSNKLSSLSLSSATGSLFLSENASENDFESDVLFSETSHQRNKPKKKNYVDNMSSIQSECTIENSEITDKNEDSISTDEYLDYINMLSKHRFQQENFWLDIGKIYYSLFPTETQKGKLMWIDKTKEILGNNLPSFFDSIESITTQSNIVYHSFASSNITVNTLMWYAKQDSPAKFKAIRHEKLDRYFRNSLSGTHTDIAILFKNITPYEIAFQPEGRNGDWYCYSEGIWNKNQAVYKIRNKISNTLFRFYKLKRNLLQNKLEEERDKEKIKKYESCITTINNIMKKFKNANFKDSLMKELKEHYCNYKFENNLDINPNLTSVANGVLEIVHDKIYFRDPKPEDFLTMKTLSQYNPDLHFQDENVKNCLEWMKKIFIHQELIEYFFKMASSSCLIAGNKEKIFPIFTGEEGNNSKSMVIKLFENTMGEYCFKFPVTVISEKPTNSGNATPQIARAKNKRIAVLDEPDDNARLKKNIIKLLTGGDSFYARMLRENGGDIRSTFVMFLVCNKVPVITDPDMAIINRTRLIPFESKFSKEHPAAEAEQFEKRIFKIDEDFEEKVKNMGAAFLWLLVQYYPKYYREKLNIPEYVKSRTEYYWDKNDLYKQFIDEHIIKDEDSEINTADCYRVFNDWNTVNGGFKINKQKFVDNMNKKLGVSTRNRWNGYNLNRAQDG